MSKLFRMKWFGDKVLKATEDQLCEILGEFALVAEGESKKELHKGHGVKTGHLRRSIHAANADYSFSKDDTGPDGSSPELGGLKIKAKKVGDKFVVRLGSGLVYALAIHQGWNWQPGGLIGTFAGYHYLTNGVDKAKAKKNQIIARHQVSK